MRLEAMKYLYDVPRCAVKSEREEPNGTAER